ncbi:hypothetical protein E4T56_gene3402 [Termitomyces sp. T112]|nr:hypothetical protein E4T56_gene3402 [Termitomyces sp. T112]
MDFSNASAYNINGCTSANGPGGPNKSIKPSGSIIKSGYGPCLWHGPVALASSQIQPHFVWLGPQYSTECLVPDPTSLCLVRSLYFKLNAKFQTQPHFVWLGPCISNSMLSPRPNLTLFSTIAGNCSELFNIEWQLCLLQIERHIQALQELIYKKTFMYSPVV